MTRPPTVMVPPFTPNRPTSTMAEPRTVPWPISVEPPATVTAPTAVSVPPRLSTRLPRTLAAPVTEMVPPAIDTAPFVFSVPICSVPVLSTELVPLTVSVPRPPDGSLTVTVPAETLPPFWMVSAPWVP